MRLLRRYPWVAYEGLRASQVTPTDSSTWGKRNMTVELGGTIRKTFLVALPL